MAANVPLSVVILTKNEAARLPECIRSVAWADDILVIDDESTDATVPIAESLGARVLRRKMDIEGRHRNWAYAQARHEWVLSLDADERVTPELAQEIQDALQNGSPHELYAIPRRNYIGTRWIRHGGWYPSAQLKLFKKAVFRWEETTVHPRAISSSDTRWGVFHGDLIHLSYRDVGDFVRKMNWQTTLEAQKWLRDGRAMSLRRALWRTVDRFVRTYVGKRGYRDGFLGWIVAVMGGIYQFLAWLKFREPVEAWRVEDVVLPVHSLVNDREHYERPLLMSHLCAYRLAGQFARRRRVLEIGCGSGYGAFYLAHLAHDMTAVDVDAQIIERARQLFRRPDLHYTQMEGRTLAFPDHAFDMVGTFQVIEHIPEPDLEMFLNEMARVVTTDGVCVISTLNLIHNQKGNPRYQKPSFHEKEFTPREFGSLLRRVFPAVEVYGLYPTRRHQCYRRLKKWGLDRWGPRRWNPVKRFFQRLDIDDYWLRVWCDPGAIDLIGLCSRTAPAAGRTLLESWRLL